MLRQGVPTGDSRGHPQAGTYFYSPRKPLLLPCAHASVSKLSSGGGRASPLHGQGSSGVPFLSSGEHFPEEMVRFSPNLLNQHVYFKAHTLVCTAPSLTTSPPDPDEAKGSPNSATNSRLLWTLLLLSQFQSNPTSI